MAASSIESHVLSVLENVSGSHQVRENLDIALFDQHILDSFDMMEVIVQLSDALEVEISPAEVERETWSTPRKIVAYLQNRVNSHSGLG